VVLIELEFQIKRGRDIYGRVAGNFAALSYRISTILDKFRILDVINELDFTIATTPPTQ
jgi:hypothetical protein